MLAVGGILGGLLGGIGKIFGGIASSVAGSVVGAVASAITQAVGEMVKTIATLWVHVPTPDLVTGGGSSGVSVQPSATVGFLQGNLQWLTVAVLVASVGIGGARLAIEYKREERVARELLTGLVRFIVASGIGVGLIWLLVQAGDEFSTWIIERSLQCVTVSGHRVCSDFGANVLVLFGFTALGTSGLGAAMLVIIFGVFAIIASAIQVALMYARGVLLVLFGGMLPLAAANFMTETGRHQWRRAVTWSTAAVLYKPAAAIVYAAAFRLAGEHAFDGGGQGSAVIAGLMMIVLALLALPALVRFIAPATAVLAGGGMGALVAGAAGAAAMSIPAGAWAGGSTAVDSAGSAGGPSPLGAPETSADPGPGEAVASAPPGGASRNGSGSGASGNGGADSGEGGTVELATADGASGGEVAAGGSWGAAGAGAAGVHAAQVAAAARSRAADEATGSGEPEGGPDGADA